MKKPPFHGISIYVNLCLVRYVPGSYVALGIGQVSLLRRFIPRSGWVTLETNYSVIDIAEKAAEGASNEQVS